MNHQNPIEIYQAQDGTTQVEVRFENEMCIRDRI